MTRSLRFYGDGISFWWHFTLIQSLSWWRMHRSAKTDASERDSIIDSSVLQLKIERD